VSATQKMDAFGMKALEEATGKNLVTLYRWRKALTTGGSISDDNKRALIAATRESDHAIQMADFFAEEIAAPAGEPGSPTPDEVVIAAGRAS